MIRKPSPSTDHLGVVHPSFRAMCRAWGINHMVVTKRLRRGCSVEVALTAKSLRKLVTPRTCVDGIDHPNLMRAAAYHGISRSLAWWRIARDGQDPALALRPTKAVRMAECAEILDRWRARYYGVAS